VVAVRNSGKVDLLVNRARPGVAAGSQAMAPFGNRTAAPRPTRRSVIAGASALALSFSATLGARSEAPLHFGLTPVFLDNDWQLLDYLRRYLEAVTRLEVRFVQRRTYKEIVALLLLGEIEAAWLCGYPLLQHQDVLSVLAMPLWRAQPLYRSYVIVPADRHLEDDLDGLRGDVHAYSDPDSNSGYLVTVSELISRNERPESFFSRAFFTYGHRNVVRAVANRLAVSGSVDGYVWEALSATEPDLVSRTRVVWRSEWLGFPPIAASIDGLQGPRVSNLQRALLGMHEHELGREALRLLQLDGFAPAEPGQFDGIARRMRILAERG
jgi:phosphonate transport system substrate-binding protein